ncbi:alkylation response protein AidB-like acyl-CoA dehydrogenase [Halopolyspora algeriensis]|uniref:Acyl-[acyl-carrier-protein] dehydrogenase MbtN n=1 Tax=Halopolyspora algeriensis TaxID=1500506 RepID=A0A368VU57_9ACTN|nr:acyl-CoA dehydrogenase family protein [Halopolyspora algeriensis]RCW45299.1 alkylation response protein AidB-like acyl-CoA dehydrogenase [Halopolyspora algeriensis]TQM47339.1 alkylation response protein AidB-like acyl-CoA dehydrogenase [Halopolyspora algeriensis]
MRRELFDDEHEAFREAARSFIDGELVPHQEEWEAAGIVSRDAWLAAGKQGLLGMSVDERHGGGGVDDFRFNVVFNEEMIAAGVSGFGVPVHNDINAPYLTRLATEEQKQRWLPGFCSGETITAIAMTEPGTGSDLQGIRTSAVRDGDDYILNGQKTFISNGINADLVIVVACTDPEAGHEGFSLLVVERGMPGFERGRNLDKIGQKSQDTAELFFNDVRVPAANLLGEEGQGFIYLMQNLPQERLSIAVASIAGAERTLEATKEYCRNRTAFGRPIGKFQHNRFELAEMATEVQIGRVFADRCVTEHLRGDLGVEHAAMAKWWLSELNKRVVDRCLQLHGGYGYMTEYPVAKAFLDSRVQTIYGGTTEIMKEIVGKSMGF